MSNLKIGRNDPCPCGSGKKFKHCCQAIPGASKAAVQPFSIPDALRTAVYHQQNGNFPQAEAIYHQILRIVPSHPDALHLLGVIALQAARIEEAISLIAKAVRNNPSNAEYFSNLGLAYQFKGGLNDALECYRKAVALKPDYADAWYNMHALLIHPENMTPAIECMQKVVALQPHDWDARLILGILLDYSGESEAAAEHLQKIEQAPPLFRARLDAWYYIKQNAQPLPPIFGSNLEAFKLGLAAANPEGLVLEFGVRHGTSIRQIAELVRSPVHGFDSFEGLPEVWHHEPKGSYTTKGEIPKVPTNVMLHVGWFEDTLPPFLDRHDDPLRFMNVDCDIYSSTKTILENLSSRIVPGSVIVFDEYIGNEHWREDEYKAFQEAVAQYGWDYEYLAFSIFTKQVVVRIKAV